MARPASGDAGEGPELDPWDVRTVASSVARPAGVREATVSLGVDELDSDAEPLGRAGAASGPPMWILGCARHCWP